MTRDHSDPSGPRRPEVDVRQRLGDLAELAPAMPPGWRASVRRRAQRQHRVTVASAVLGTAVAGSVVGVGATQWRGASAAGLAAAGPTPPSTSVSCTELLPPVATPSPSVPEESLSPTPSPSVPEESPTPTPSVPEATPSPTPSDGDCTEVAGPTPTTDEPSPSEAWVTPTPTRTGSPASPSGGVTSPVPTATSSAAVASPAPSGAVGVPSPTASPMPPSPTPTLSSS